MLRSDHVSYACMCTKYMQRYMCSHDDLHWLCNKASVLPWEGLGLLESDVARMLEAWLWTENERVMVDDMRLRHGLPPMSDDQAYFLHNHVWQLRMRSLREQERALACEYWCRI
jgi:hypothetical protein